MKYLILILNAIILIVLSVENNRLHKKLTEQTDKHWEANRQIALYSDELNKLGKIVRGE